MTGARIFGGLWVVFGLVGCGIEADLSRAEKALALNDLDKAEKRFRKVLAREPEHAQALYGLGWAYHLGSQPDRAREFFVRCRRVAPEDHRCEKGLGSVALSQGNLLLAEDHLGSALALAPEDPAVVNSLALVHLAGKRYEAALALLSPLVIRVSNRGEYRLNLAEALYRLERYEEALQEVDKALSTPIQERRFVALLLHLRARVVLAMTSGRMDPEDCEGTLPPLLAWLDRASQDLDKAEKVGLVAEEIRLVRHKLHRRRSILMETCVGSTLPL